MFKKKKKSTFTYDPDTGLMKRNISKDNVKKREKGSVLCCASPLIITKDTYIGT